MMKLFSKSIMILLLTITAACAIGEGDAMDSYGGSGDPLFVAVADDSSTYYSRDGKVWLRGGDTAGGNSSVAYGNGVFVSGQDGTIGVSIDGINWIDYTFAQAGISGTTLQTIQYGKEMFTGGTDDGRIFYSVNGNNWFQTSKGLGSPINSISYGNGKFFFTTADGASIEASNDGINWYNTAVSFDTNDVLHGITFGNTVFLVVGNTGSNEAIFAISKDGALWSSNIAPVANSTHIYSIAFGNGTFVAGGRNTGSGDGVIYVSENGFVWGGPFTLPNEISEIAYNNGIFVAVGGSGSIFYSEDGYTWSGNIGPGGAYISDVTVRP